MDSEQIYGRNEIRNIKPQNFRNRYNEHIVLMTYYLWKIKMYGAVAMGGGWLF